MVARSLSRVEIAGLVATISVAAAMVMANSVSAVSSVRATTKISSQRDDAQT
jgi:hypothetical protein